MSSLTIPQTFELAAHLHNSGRLDEAEQLYRLILARDPHHSDSLNHLGVIAAQRGQNQTAAALFAKAIEINPRSAAAFENLGNVLTRAGALDQAIASFKSAIALNPNLGQTYGNLGAALRERGLPEESIVACRKALAINPHDLDARSNLASALNALLRLDESLIECRQVLSVSPEHSEAHYNMAYPLLMRGDLLNGARELEWFRNSSNYPQIQVTPDMPQTIWDGSALNGRSILLHAEQGLGDTIQFIRYAPEIARQGGKVIVVCQPELVDLIRSVDGVSSVVARGAPLPSCDLRCPLFSLWRIFGTTLETIPAAVPYLRTDPLRVREWKARLAALASPKVGLVWAGNPDHRNDINRSVALSQFDWLTRGSATVISLQKGKAVSQIAACEPEMRIVDWTNDLRDFADTAALITSLDLVITVDTAVAHLAGALGKPVWTLIPFAPDWRWMLERTDSPWYPTMRLFRQAAPKDWASAMNAASVAYLNWLNATKNNLTI